MRAAVLAVALAFSLSALAAECIHADWIQSNGPCSEHADCSRVVYKCKGIDGKGGCGRSYTVHFKGDTDPAEWPTRRKR